MLRVAVSSLKRSHLVLTTTLCHSTLCYYFFKAYFFNYLFIWEYQLLSEACRI